MHTVTDPSVEKTPSDVATGRPRSSRRLTKALLDVAVWLSERLDPPPAEFTRSRRLQLAVAFASIFLLSLGVRALQWQDSYVDLAQKGQWMIGIAALYEDEALRMRNEGTTLFPRGPVDPGDAHLVLHPPGYSAFMAGIFAVWAKSDFAVRVAQITFDALSVVMILLIAVELFNSALAIIAAVLAALSPHFGHYSLWTSPDTLCVLPILLAVYLSIKTIKRPRLRTIVGAGTMVGLSCWLRANAMLVAPFLALVVVLLMDRPKRIRYAVAFVGTTILVVSPITIRNWILFHHFIPISIGGGANFIVGIADFDKEGRFGMPNSDVDAAAKDALWYNRPEYAQSAWRPDGVERDQNRYARGIEVVRSNPGWFLGAMFQRAFFMLSYNDRPGADWPFNTSTLPSVKTLPPPLHSPATIAGKTPLWSRTGPGLLADGSLLSEHAQASLDTAGRLLIGGDGSEFGDQFTSAPIAVEQNTDYVLSLEVVLDEGLAAAKVVSSDGAALLESAIITGEERRRRVRTLSNKDDTATKLDPEDRMALIQIVFPSRERNEVRLVISINGPPGTVIKIRQVDFHRLGATPYLWTSYPRIRVNGIQEFLFSTTKMLPLVAGGVLLLGLAAQRRALVILLAVPAYYLTVQSAFHTEYRYILAMHYFLFILAAVTLYCSGRFVGQAIPLLITTLPGRIRKRL